MLSVPGSINPPIWVVGGLNSGSVQVYSYHWQVRLHSALDGKDWKIASLIEPLYLSVILITLFVASYSI